MYILSDNFLGNIIPSKTAYLKGNKLYYSNDGKNFKDRFIRNKDLHAGKLNCFNTYIRIYKNAENGLVEDFKEWIEPCVEDDCMLGRVYLKVLLSSANEIINLIPQHKEDIKGRIFEPLHKVIPDAPCHAIDMYKHDIHIITFDSEPKENTFQYLAHFVLPTMSFHQNYKLYSFDVLKIANYSFKEE